MDILKVTKVDGTVKVEVLKHFDKFGNCFETVLDYGNMYDNSANMSSGEDKSKMLVYYKTEDEWDDATSIAFFSHALGVPVCEAVICTAVGQDTDELNADIRTYTKYADNDELDAMDPEKAVPILEKYGVPMEKQFENIMSLLF